MPELLNSVSSQELAEFQAYEMLNGFIGTAYQDELLASIHEQLQQVCRILIATNTEEDDRDQIPDLQRYPRTRDIYMAQLEVGDDG